MPDTIPNLHQWERGPKITAIGGGTGLSTMLRGLKKYTRNLTAVVTVADDGEGHLIASVEGAEDNRDLGKEDLEKLNFSQKDVLCGIAASGRTRYVLGAMEYAHSLGAAVISVTCCPGSEVDTRADIGISPMPGPEVITGSCLLYTSPSPRDCS